MILLGAFGALALELNDLFDGCALSLDCGLELDY